jgi:hypothetical protein
LNGLEFVEWDYDLIYSFKDYSDEARNLRELINQEQSSCSTIFPLMALTWNSVIPSFVFPCPGATENLDGHDAGNGGYSQGDT